MQFTALNSYPARTDTGYSFELVGELTVLPERNITHSNCNVTVESFEANTGYSCHDLFGPYRIPPTSPDKVEKSTVFVISYKHQFFNETDPDESSLARVPNEEAQFILATVHHVARCASVTEFWIWTDRCVAWSSNKSSRWIEKGLLPYLHAPVIGMSAEHSGTRLWIMAERLLGTHAKGYIGIRGGFGEGFGRSTVITDYSAENAETVIACRICLGILDHTTVTYEQDRHDLLDWAFERTAHLSPLRIITTAGLVRSRFGGFGVWLPDTARTADPPWFPAGEELDRRRQTNDMEGLEELKYRDVTVLFTYKALNGTQGVVKLSDDDGGCAYFIVDFQTNGANSVHEYRPFRSMRLFVTQGPMVKDEDVMGVIMHFVCRIRQKHPHSDEYLYCGEQKW